MEKENQQDCLNKLNKKQRKARKRYFEITGKLAMKTKALWYAAQVIQEKIEPEKTVDQVYNMLLFIGKNQLLQEKPELAEIFCKKENKEGK